MQSVLHGDRPFSAGELSDFILQAFDSIAGYSEVDFSFSHVEAVAQKCLSEETADAAFLPVHFQFEFDFDVLGDAFHDSLCCPGCFYVDVAVVCVAYEGLASSFQFFVQVVQHDITEQWAQWSALCKASCYAKLNAEVFAKTEKRLEQLGIIFDDGAEHSSIHH